MNVKRAISLSLLFFANLIVLAHVVIPHHYHDNTSVCFSLHCQDSKRAHHHDPDDKQTHQHEGNPSSDKCSLDTFYFSADKNENSLCGLHHEFYSGTNPIEDGFFVETELICILQDTYIPRFYSGFFSQSNGLRAPPLQ
jgi:hypothetical protein